MDTHIQKLEVKNGGYTTAPILTESEWKEMLDKVDLDSHGRQFEILLMFYRKAEHKATCKQIGSDFSLKASSVRSIITNFCRYIKKRHP